MFIPGTKSRCSCYLFAAFAFIVLAQILPASSALGQSDHAVQGQQGFDGSWWKKASPDERTGYLYALDDCLTFDAKPALGFDDSWFNYEQKITKYYDASPSNNMASVQSVFGRFGRRGALAREAHSKERYGDEFWRAHSEIARRGFIEGYISCRVQQVNAPKFSQPVTSYVQELDDLYNADDRHGENAAEYTGSIASALEKFTHLQ